MGLMSYVARRILLMIPTLIGVTLLIFAVTQMIDPVSRAMLYIKSEKELQHIDDIISRYGLNDPVYLQYGRWIQQILTGNLGWSVSTRLPVLKALSTRFPATFELVIFSIPPTILLGIYLGVKSAVHKDKAIDHVTRTVSIIGWSLPTFWLAIVLLSFCYGRYHLFPPSRLTEAAIQFIHTEQFISYTGLYTIDGLLNGQPWITLDAIQHLVLPVVTLTVVQIALIIRVMRSSMLETLHKGYIFTARAKGLANKQVINKHARRNALIPIITLSGMLAAGMLTGVIITETVFDFNGIGRFAATAATRLDTSAVLGFSLLAGVIFVVANLIVDIAYAYVDPRIRLG